MNEAGVGFSDIRATYRLQFHKDFTFRDAEAVVPYLARLGISHAPEVECIGKGKARAPYEFGCKVSITTPATKPKGGQFVLHVAKGRRPPG